MNNERTLKDYLCSISMKKWLFVLIPFVLIFVLFFIRLFSHVEVDDVSSSVPCEEWILEEADVYYVIPQFDGIVNNESWCNDILSMNKELAIHGVTHEYKEFETFRDKDYLNVGINDFVNCFGFSPEKFKPPNLRWTTENNWILDELDVEFWPNQFTHKVYHCNDTGIFPNWFIRIF